MCALAVFLFRRKGFFMKKSLIAILCGLSLVACMSPTIFAMEPRAAELTPVSTSAPAPALSPEQIMQLQAQLAATKKPCCCVTCWPMFCKCCTSFSSALVSYSDVALTIAGAVVTDPKAKATLATIQTVMTASKPAILALLQKCQDASTAIDPNAEALLKAQHLLKPDGTVDPAVSAIAQAAIKVTTPTRLVTTRALGTTVIPHVVLRIDPRNQEHINALMAELSLRDDAVVYSISRVLGEE